MSKINGMKVSGWVKEWRRFLRVELGCLPPEIDLQEIDFLPVDELAELVEKHPALKRKYTDKRILDELMSITEARTLPDREFIGKRVCLDEHYAASISIANHGAYMRELLDCMGRPKRWFDNCCGYGTYPSFLIRNGIFRGEAFGIDGSLTMVANAERLREKLGVEYDLRHGWADQLPYQDGFFDFGSWIDALQYILEWKRAVREFARTLEDGGRFLLIYPLGFIRQNIPAEEVISTMYSAGLDVINSVELETDTLYNRAVIHGIKQKPTVSLIVPGQASTTNS